MNIQFVDRFQVNYRAAFSVRLTYEVAQVSQQFGGFGRSQVERRINHCFVAIDIMDTQVKLLRRFENRSDGQIVGVLRRTRVSVLISLDFRRHRLIYRGVQV